MKPLVSLIVPTIGRPVFFAKALASVAAQTYPNLEIFVSDNAAEVPVSEAEVRSACCVRPFRLVRRGKRIGFAEHFNTCLKEASGHYAMFLSDDDLLVPRFVETAVECMESKPGVGAVLSHQERIDENFLGEAPQLDLTWKVDVAENFYLRCFRDCLEKNFLTFVSLFGRRDELLEAGGFGIYPSGAHSDIELLLAVTLGRKIGLVSGGFLYRVYPTSVGLGMPWIHLQNGTAGFEARLTSWHQQGRMSASLLKAMLRNHTTMMMGRYRLLYRRKAGAANKVKPMLDMGRRIIVNLLKYGPAATPVLHRLYRHGQ
jgi:glycosyltransferase involved in cell wall biosynthesis